MATAEALKKFDTDGRPIKWGKTKMTARSKDNKTYPSYGSIQLERYVYQCPRVSLSLDGTYVLMREDGYREAIVGNLSLYDVAGKYQHTVYIGEALERERDIFQADGKGMRWKSQGANVIISLRALIQSKGRWQQFWDKVDQYGAYVCA